MNVRIEGLDDVVERIVREADQAVSRVLLDEGRAIVAAASAAAPERTGRFAAGFSARLVGEDLVIENTVPYALDVHDGRAWRELVEEPVAALCADPVAVVRELEDLVSRVGR